jgi:hypothetical protein
LDILSPICENKADECYVTIMLGLPSHHGPLPHVPTLPTFICGLAANMIIAGVSLSVTAGRGQLRFSGPAGITPSGWFKRQTLRPREHPDLNTRNPSRPVVEFAHGTAMKTQRRQFLKSTASLAAISSVPARLAQVANTSRSYP